MVGRHPDGELRISRLARGMAQQKYRFCDVMAGAFADALEGEVT